MIGLEDQDLSMVVNKHSMQFIRRDRLWGLFASISKEGELSVGLSIPKAVNSHNCRLSRACTEVYRRWIGDG